MGGESPAPADAAKNSEDSALHSEWEVGNGDGVEVSIEENRCLERARHSSVVEMTVTCEPEPSVAQPPKASMPTRTVTGAGISASKAPTPPATTATCASSRNNATASPKPAKRCPPTAAVASVGVAVRR